MTNDTRDMNPPAIRALERFRVLPKFRVLPFVLHCLSIVVTAFAAAFIKDNLTLATLVFAMSVGVVLGAFVLCIQRLDHSIGGLGSVLLKVDYLRMHEVRDGVEITEGYVYQRAATETQNARQSIDAFTSYLLEADCRGERDLDTQKSYFTALLELATDSARPVLYRRLVQAKANKDLIRGFKASHAQAYLDHLIGMQECEEAGKTVHVKVIDRRRPTTYVIIDEVVLLWQINSINDNNEMQMHGMFIIYDPAHVFIRYFRHEFDHYWNGEAKPLRVKTVARS